MGCCNLRRCLTPRSILKKFVIVLCFVIFIHAELHILDYIRQRAAKAGARDVALAKAGAAGNDKNARDILRRLSKLPGNLGIAKPKEKTDKNNFSSKALETQTPVRLETQKPIVVSKDTRTLDERTYVFNIEDGNLVFPADKVSD